MADRLSIDGAVVLITGAGAGIGLQLVLETLRRGGIPVAVEVEAEAAGALERELSGRGAVHLADVRDAAAMAQVAKETIASYGGIDVVIANAGIERAGPTEDMPPESFEEVIEVNLLGVYRTIQPALASVVARGGHITAVSSIAGLLPFPLATAYSTSKAGVDMMMRVLRMELSGTGATAGAAYFGFVGTAMGERILSQDMISRVVRRQPTHLLGIYPLVSPARAAERILNGVERRKARVYAPRMVALSHAMRGLYPAFDGIFARHVVRMAEVIRDFRSTMR